MLYQLQVINVISIVVWKLFFCRKRYVKVTDNLRAIESAFHCLQKLKINSAEFTFHKYQKKMIRLLLIMNAKAVNSTFLKLQSWITFLIYDKSPHWNLLKVITKRGSTNWEWLKEVRSQYLKSSFSIFKSKDFDHSKSVIIHKKSKGNSEITYYLQKKPLV